MPRPVAPYGDPKPQPTPRPLVTTGVVQVTNTSPTPFRSGALVIPPNATVLVDLEAQRWRVSDVSTPQGFLIDVSPNPAVPHLVRNLVH